jgi:hypothetical protein
MTIHQSDKTKMPEPTIDTTLPADQSRAHRLPSDRDESPDELLSGTPREDMQQAARDIASGQVDTDRYGQPARNPNNRIPATPSPKNTQPLPDGSNR